MIIINATDGVSFNRLHPASRLQLISAPRKQKEGIFTEYVTFKFTHD